MGSGQLLVHAPQSVEGRRHIEIGRHGIAQVAFGHRAAIDEGAQGVIAGGHHDHPVAQRTGLEPVEKRAQAVALVVIAGELAELVLVPVVKTPQGRFQRRTTIVRRQPHRRMVVGGQQEAEQGAAGTLGLFEFLFQVIEHIFVIDAPGIVAGIDLEPRLDLGTAEVAIEALQGPEQVVIAPGGIAATEKQRIVTLPLEGQHIGEPEAGLPRHRLGDRRDRRIQQQGFDGRIGAVGIGEEAGEEMILVGMPSESAQHLVVRPVAARDFRRPALHLNEHDMHGFLPPGQHCPALTHQRMLPGIAGLAQQFLVAAETMVGQGVAPEGGLVVDRMIPPGVIEVETAVHHQGIDEGVVAHRGMLALQREMVQGTARKKCQQQQGDQPGQARPGQPRPEFGKTALPAQHQPQTAPQQLREQDQQTQHPAIGLHGFQDRPGIVLQQTEDQHIDGLAVIGQVTDIGQLQPQQQGHGQGQINLQQKVKDAARQQQGERRQQPGQQQDRGDQLEIETRTAQEQVIEETEACGQLGRVGKQQQLGQPRQGQQQQGQQEKGARRRQQLGQAAPPAISQRHRHRDGGD